MATNKRKSSKKRKATNKRKSTKKGKGRATAAYTILAVAVGDNLVNGLLINSDPAPSGVRPYIQGLINGLAADEYTIGNDYVINYNQCKASQLPQLFRKATTPSAVFCMSTRVVDAACAQFGNDANVTIVGIVSDHTKYDANYTNVCGFSAKRFQSASDCYDNFIKTVPTLTAIYVLSEKNYPPSDNALSSITESHPEGDKFYPIEVDVTEGKNIDNELAKKHIPNTAGIFVLPIDRCFGEADDILGWAANNSVPTFWPVTDWVKSTAYPCALGGYGVSQELCGFRMAAKLASRWSSDRMPAPKFDDCVPNLISAGGDFSWTASLNAYQQLGIDLVAPLPAGLNII